MTLQEVQCLLHRLRDNVYQVAAEWKAVKHDLLLEGLEGTSQNEVPDKSFVKVKRIALRNLKAEIKQLKQTLPKIVNYDLLQTFANEVKLEKECRASKKQAADAEEESSHWKARHDAARGEYEKERKEKLSLKGELSQTNQRVAMQSDYCAGMGSVCCTLLWRASQHEEAIPALLIGSQMQNFMSVVCHTLDSFVATYQDEDVPLEHSEELQFVLALCGTITNIAASAYGRDYLATNSVCGQLVQTFISMLSTPAAKSLSKVKNLILMALYNLSINQKGLDSLSKTKGIVSLLVWLLQAEASPEIRLHTLLLIQSLIMENSNKALLHEVKDLLSMDVLESLTSDASMEVKEVTGEIIQVLNSLRKHEP